MKKWVDTKSIKFRLWIYFVLFTAVIMIVLWLLQIIFFKTYYQGMKINEIKKIGNTLISEYGQEDFADTVYRISYNNGINIEVFNDQGKSILSSSMFGQMKPPRTDPMAMSIFMQKLLQSGSDRVYYTADDPRLERQILVFGAKLESSDGENVYLYLNSPLAPVDSTTMVLKNQLIIVTIISLLLALALSFLIASRLSKPITRITGTAAGLAQGNYDIVFKKSGYTEISQLATTLNYVTLQLSKTEELRRDLIANVSHDLRTPLTMVKAYAEMIRDLSGDNPVKRNAHTKVIIEEADRLSTLVSDILDLSKIQSGATELDYANCNISEMTRNILFRFHVLSERDGYVFSLNCDENAVAPADSHKMEQVIYNLVSNAVNYTGEDKKVSITVKNTVDSVEFEVTDTGNGIPEEQLEQIWERYYKSKETHRRPVVGTGLGLSIVKSILTAHNAEYGVRSTVGKGSTFWFKLDKRQAT